MNRLLNTIDKISATQAEIRELEAAIEQFPDTKSLVLGLRSVERRHEELEAEFRELSHEQFLDVCRYRMFAQEGEQRFTVPALASALADFQSLFSNVYDAIKNGARQRSRTRPEIAAVSTFEFGYSFSGSVGFVLTLPNDRLLTNETDLDRTINTIFEMTKAQESDEILHFAKQLGAAPIRAMYRWVSDHVDSGLGADIGWLREHEVRAELVAQIPELRKVQRAINQTSDESIEEFNAIGELLGADVSTNTFHFKLEEGTDIRGRMELDINEQNTVALPRRYRARIKKVTTISYSTEEERAVYYLTAIVE